MSYTGIFDSHAHYNDRHFKNELELLIPKFDETGVAHIANVGYDMKTSSTSVNLSKKHSFMYATVGIHPHYANGMVEGDIDKLEAWAKEKKVCAIGEIGLDYYRNISPKDVQKKAFEKQLELAKSLDMPVVIHMREATQDTLDILEKYRPKGVIHSFSGSKEVARQALNLGMYLGFTGVVTYKNARNVLDALDEVPLDKFLIETDCPYLTPEPFRGQKNDSTLLPYIIEKIAKVKKIKPQNVADYSRNNALNMYEIK